MPRLEQLKTDYLTVLRDYAQARQASNNAPANAARKGQAEALQDLQKALTHVTQHLRMLLLYDKVRSAFTDAKRALLVGYLLVGGGGLLFAYAANPPKPPTPPPPAPVATTGPITVRVTFPRPPPPRRPGHRHDHGDPDRRPADSP